MRNNSFIAPPNNIDPVLRRFLETLVRKLDTAYSERGTNGFVSINVLNEALALVYAEIEDLTLKAVVVTEDYTALVGNYLLSASGNTTITLPAASEAVGYVYTITKVDNSADIIVVTSSSSVGGEASQDLVKQSESLSFFSDGIAWRVR